MKNLKILIVLGALSIAAACGEAGPANTAVNNAAVSNANTTSVSVPGHASSPADEFAMGRTLYEQNCAGCHKEDGTGGAITIEGKTIDPDDLTSDKIKKMDESRITKYVYDGIEDEGMPAFKDKLTEAQIREVVRYVRAGIQKMPSAPVKPLANQ
jgi:mono/diheme cytochrome c family protein